MTVKKTTKIHHENFLNLRHVVVCNFIEILFSRPNGNLATRVGVPGTCTITKKSHSRDGIIISNGFFLLSYGWRRSIVLWHS